MARNVHMPSGTPGPHGGRIGTLGLRAMSIPATQAASGRGTAAADAVRTLLPGLAVAAAVGLAARLLSGAAPPWVGEIFLAVLLGITVGVFVRSSRLAPGFKFAVVRLLRIGVALLGARLTIAAVAEIGLSAIVLVVIVIALALTLTLLAGRAFGLPAPLALLIGVGTAICGNSAIVATAPIIGAETKHVSVAVATITIFGMLAVLLYPLIGTWLQLPDVVFGTWAGIAVNDTSQVVAASFAYSDPAGDVAVVVKLVRNTAIAPVLLLVGALWAGYASRSGSGAGLDNPGGTDVGRRRVRFRDAVPLFAIGFIALAAISSMGLLSPVVAGRSLADWAGEVSKVLLLIAVAAIGLGTSPSVLRATGPRPFLVGLGVSAVVSVSALLLVVWTNGVIIGP
jgi:uncharacterized integral membrane protein (TIGR00698 family)